MNPTGRLVVRGAVAVVWIGAVALLLALGTWQVQRRSWKLDLIHRVETRLSAAPVPAPRSAGPDDAYRRVRASGNFVVGRDSFVQAVTDRGAGWWVLTPLKTPDTTILVNRGFVERRAATPPPPPGEVTIQGLLRLSEPGGGFLRSNVPHLDRWYSRDVAAIAKRRGLGQAAPYFIDADAQPSAKPGDPIGGLTVVRFTNNHLAYAITWYMLAIMTAAGFVYWMFGRRRVDRPRP
ncbi:SURF1 family protein [Sphingomonas aerophila]|jgi:surfeit locus 1 family protein|uniref:SURF1-like protein n=1 Tax=Sphingomonas aerophila TaxID=1344948 RepID=A0A7W9BED2_9SPHN|nr:SURF1 family protein [Sphingomonas aerophila]MBB5715622.1 surfeit locus 1 family protein [Sphingomonas aerophila]